MDIEEKAVAELSGSVAAALLTHVRSMETPWSKLKQRDQQDKIDAVESMAEDMVRKAVATIAKRGFDTIPVRIKDFTVKDGALKGKFDALVTADNVTALGEHQGASAFIVLASAADFIGGNAGAPGLDEPELPVDDGGDLPSSTPPAH